MSLIDREKLRADIRDLPLEIPLTERSVLALIDAAPAAEPVPLTLDALTRALRYVAETEPGTLAHADQENGGLGPEYAARSIHEALAALASPDKGEPRSARDPESPADAALILAPDFTDYDDD